jgi:hypothetical protein
LAGVVRAHEAAKVTGVRLVVGCRLDLSDGMSLLVFPIDRAAYSRLCRLLSLGKKRAGKAKCDLARADLVAYGEGLIAVLAPDEADEDCALRLRRLREAFADRAYVTLSLRRRPNDQLRLFELSNLATSMRVPTIVTNDVLFHEPRRRILQDVVTCIRHNVTIDELGDRRERHAASRVIDEAYEADPASAAAEYNAEFRTDIQSYIAIEAVLACVSTGCFERPPVPDEYFSAFIDPSGGSGADAMTLAVGHRRDDTVVIDALRSRAPPFSPDDVCAEFAALLRSYRITTVHGDRYAGEWPRERLRAHDIGYEPAEKPKSDLYRDLLPLINARRIELIDDKKLVAQLVGLERRTSRAGKDSIDHGPSGHDDSANAIAGVASLLAVGSSYNDVAWVGEIPESWKNQPYFARMMGGLPWLQR